MKYSVTRTQVFSMAPYEKLEVSATVEFDTEETGISSPAEAAKLADETLTALLQPDIDRADQSSATPEDSTYLHAWKDSL